MEVPGVSYTKMSASNKYFYHWVWAVSWFFCHFESIWKMAVAVDHPVPGSDKILAPFWPRMASLSLIWFGNGPTLEVFSRSDWNFLCIKTTWEQHHEFGCSSKAVVPFSWCAGIACWLILDQSSQYTWPNLPHQIRAAGPWSLILDPWFLIFVPWSLILDLCSLIPNQFGCMKWAGVAAANLGGGWD